MLEALLIGAMTVVVGLLAGLGLAKDALLGSGEEP